MGYWYVATPYAKFPGGKVAAFIEACQHTATLAKAGIPVFSPIAHSHSVALHGEIEATDHDYWMNFDKPMMDAAFGLIVVEIDTWQISRGIAYEIETFIKAFKPVFFTNPKVPLTAADIEFLRNT